jgi:hypothetical protein
MLMRWNRLYSKFMLVDSGGGSVSALVRGARLRMAKRRVMAQARILVFM